MDFISRNHTQGVLDDFKSLVSERHFPTDMISNVIVLSQGALWKHRMIRDPVAPNRKSDASPPPSVSAAVIESRIFSHLLALYRVLLEVGLDELKEPPPIDVAENDLAQRITATFRRTLPALRIASKWFRANYKYVMQGQDLATIRKNEGKEHKISGTSNGVPQFWEVYADFSRTLSRAFPEDRLPSLDAPLEEDVEMRGFLPLRKMMGEAKTVSQNDVDQERVAVAQGQTQEQVHPNVEQLMRISDLLDDAKALVQMEVSKLYLLPCISSSNGSVLLVLPHRVIRQSICSQRCRSGTTPPAYKCRSQKRPRRRRRADSSTTVANCNQRRPSGITERQRS
jgi:protein SMG7